MHDVDIEPLELVAIARRARVAAAAAEYEAVRAANRAGHSWDKIAPIYGRTRQAVYERFKKPPTD